MTTEGILIALITVIGALFVAFVTGTVAYVIKTLQSALVETKKELMKDDDSNIKKSEESDEAIRNEMKYLKEQFERQRKDDKIELYRSIDRLEAVDSDRRGDVKELFNKYETARKDADERIIEELRDRIKELESK